MTKLSVFLWVTVSVLLFPIAPVIAQSVWYGADAAIDAGVFGNEATRIYFDQEGSLYPDATAATLVEQESFQYHKGKLQYYYQYSRKTTKGHAPKQRQEYARLQQHYGLPPVPASGLAGPDNEAWRQLQYAMQNRFINQLQRHLQQANIERLVVLVHGFNNEADGAQWFYRIEQRIRNQYFQGEKVYFLEIRWDGRASGPLKLPQIWQYAQYSMYPVGLGLRRILHGVGAAKPDMPVYLMGHSTGAPLLSVALWNSKNALQPHKELTIWGRNYVALLQDTIYATPVLPKARILLVAPAMPASHFLNYLERTPAVNTSSEDSRRGIYARFVVAQNQNDFSTGKGGFSPHLLGSTEMGVCPSAFCRAAQALAAGGTASYLYDFTGGMQQAGVRTGHGVVQFMQDKPLFTCLLDTWLQEASPSAACPVVGCPAVSAARCK